jgi:hypothetical protein
MDGLSEEKLRILVEMLGWSRARARGYVKGEAARRCGEIPPPHSIVGIDEYALGYRAGYFVRESTRFQSEETKGADPGPLRNIS